MYIYVPHMLNFLILKNTKNTDLAIVIYNKENYLTFKIKTMQFLKYSNFIKLLSNTVQLNKLNILEQHLYSYNNLYFKKINFKGKGYKITKKKKIFNIKF